METGSSQSETLNFIFSNEKFRPPANMAAIMMNAANMAYRKAISKTRERLANNPSMTVPQLIFLFPSLVTDGPRSFFWPS